MFQMDPSEPSPSGTMMTSSGQSQRRARKPLAKPAGTWVVERVDSVIGIPDPEVTLKKWRTSCGVIAHARVPITHLEWSDVTEAERKNPVHRTKAVIQGSGGSRRGIPAS